MSEEENLEVVHRYVGLLDAGQYEEANELLDDLGTWWSNWRRVAVPMRDFKESVGPAVAIMQVSMTIHTMEAFGDKVLLEAESFAQLPEGEPYNNVYCMILTVRHGKIQHGREYMDTRHATALPPEFTDLAKH